MTAYDLLCHRVCSQQKIMGVATQASTIFSQSVMKRCLLIIPKYHVVFSVYTPLSKVNSGTTFILYVSLHILWTVFFLPIWYWIPVHLKLEGFSGSNDLNEWMNEYSWECMFCLMYNDYLLFRSPNGTKQAPFWNKQLIPH